MTWKEAFPSIFQVQDTTAITWFADNTLLYGDNTTFRSGAISNKDTTTVIITFTLTSPGSITFNYKRKSEIINGVFMVLIDSSQVLRVTGGNDWTTFTQQLGVGSHTIQYTCIEDVSESADSVVFALGYIELDGVRPAFDIWCLIKNNSNDKFYKEVDGVLEEVTIAGSEPTLEEFRDYGNEALPNTGILTNIARYTILKCIDTPDQQDKDTLVNVSIQGNMKPTLLKLDPPVVMVEEYQTGFNKVEASLTHVVTTDMKFVISYDNSTWYAYDGATWVTVDYSEEAVLLDGMTETTLNTLTATEFSLLYTGTEPLVMWIALVVKSTAADNWSINSLRISFTTNL